jgi:hypothetical protein
LTNPTTCVAAIAIILFSFPWSEAGARPNRHSFTFPGKPASVSSQSGALSARYSDPGVNPDGIHEDRFSIADANGRELVGFSFLRSVRGAWSADKDTLFVNNFTGSNDSDCLVTRTSNETVRLVSLTDILINDPHSGPVEVGKIKPPENPGNSHYYLRCEKWLSPSMIAVILDGHTDAGGYFKYQFHYNVDKKRFDLK